MIADQRFESWSAPESPVMIEYSMVVIEEIRREVAEGFQRFSRGGIEVGGVLYGTRDGTTIRLQAMRPIACEHARGPAFILSEKDEAALAGQLEGDKSAPQLERMECVGWFLSHTRTDICLSDTDLALYSRFFPDAWKLTMVVRPGRSGSMRAGFFVREPDGTIKSDHSYQEFSFPDRLAGVFDPGARAARPSGERVPAERAGGMARRSERAEPSTEALPRREYTAESTAEPGRLDDAPLFLAAQKRSARRWPWLVLTGIVVALAGGAAGYRFFPAAGSEPAGLTVVERDGQLQIEWNRASRVIANASRGKIEIADGASNRTIPLAASDLGTGKVTYARTTGDVEVRMEVENAVGGVTLEASRFLGAPPRRADSDETKLLEQRRSELEAEIARLRDENSAQAERIQQLERTLRIMQSRSANK